MGRQALSLEQRKAREREKSRRHFINPTAKERKLELDRVYHQRKRERGKALNGILHWGRRSIYDQWLISYLVQETSEPTREDGEVIENYFHTVADFDDFPDDGSFREMDDDGLGGFTINYDSIPDDYNGM